MNVYISMGMELTSVFGIIMMIILLSVSWLLWCMTFDFELVRLPFDPSCTVDMSSLVVQLCSKLTLLYGMLASMRHHSLSAIMISLNFVMFRMNLRQCMLCTYCMM